MRGRIKADRDVVARPGIDHCGGSVVGPPVDETKLRRVKRLIARRLNATQIAAALGITPGGVVRYLRRHGLRAKVNDGRGYSGRRYTSEEDRLIRSAVAILAVQMSRKDSEIASRVNTLYMSRRHTGGSKRSRR